MQLVGEISIKYLYLIKKNIYHGGRNIFNCSRVDKHKIVKKVYITNTGDIHVCVCETYTYVSVCVCIDKTMK